MLMRRGREKLMLPIHRKERDQLQRPQLVSWKLLWTLYLMRAAFFTMYTRIPFFMGLSLLLMPSVRCFSTNRPHRCPCHLPSEVHAERARPPLRCPRFRSLQRHRN
ncbi:Uncharacterized protein Rs2_15655 [Raphanus sativus]|nr:Uncharacterized protein Rs2_15655 [Raphanus sativus]